MKGNTLHIMHADDDIDTCTFFKAAAAQFSASTNLTTVHDGVELMQVIEKLEDKLPDALFLDVNMPLKNGYECMTELKEAGILGRIPVIVFSTSLDTVAIDYLYNKGATFFIRKPAEFFLFKKVILHALSLICQGISVQPPRDQFMFTAESKLHTEKRAQS